MALWQGVDYGLISVAIHFKGLLESYIQTGWNVDSRASEINLQMYCLSLRKVAVGLFPWWGSWTERIIPDDTHLELIQMTAKRGKKHFVDIHEAYEIPLSNLTSVSGSQTARKVA